jgi:hypothetical protein
MRHAIVVSLAILIGTRGASALQDNPESAILRRAASAVQKAEPMWWFIRAILNGPPLMDEQLGAAAGAWYRSLDDPSTVVNVEIYRISTTDASAVWLYRQAHGGVNKEWTVTSYELGDGALYFRKGRFLAHLGGRSKDSVEHFARILLAEMSD